MQLFLSIFIFLSVSFLSVMADSATITDEKLIMPLTSIVEKQDMKFEHFKETTELTVKHELETTKNALDETNVHIGYVSDRIDNISASIDKFAILTTFFGVLITIIVFFFSFKSNSEARQTVEDWLEENGDDFVKKEMQPIKDDFNKMITNMQKEMEIFKQKSDEEIEFLKKQLEEKGNEFLDNLSSKTIDNDITDNELSIEDKQYFEYQIKLIKSKPVKLRTFQDYKKIIFFNILSKNYQRAIEDIEKLLRGDYLDIEKSWLFYLKGLTEDKQDLYNKAIDSFNKAIELDSTLSIAYTAKAKIYNIEKQDYMKAIELANKAIELDKNNYDAYISLGYGIRNKAYYEKKPKLYEDAILYNKKAIEINPDFELAYNNIGSIYLMQKKYEDARKWYYDSLRVNENEKEWVYINLFRIYLILDENFPKELEENYLKFFNKKNSLKFLMYEMLKILENIANNKYKNKEIIENVIHEWSQSNNTKLKHYTLKPLEDWSKTKKNELVKNNLLYALNLFDKHRIKSSHNGFIVSEL